ncbi:MAG: hypothetical protein HZB29_01140 [Nitrospinae bacterium]|nr:hypothetical protein [Nitrospinota bacterium]
MTKLDMVLRSGIIFICAMAFIAAMMAGVAPAQATRESDLTAICHNPGPGQRTIGVHPAELAAHLAHGDYKGACSSAAGELKGSSGGTSGATGGTTGGAAGSAKDIKGANGTGGTTGGAAGSVR